MQQAEVYRLNKQKQKRYPDMEMKKKLIIVKVGRN